MSRRSSKVKRFDKHPREEKLNQEIEEIEDDGYSLYDIEEIGSKIYLLFYPVAKTPSIN